MAVIFCFVSSTADCHQTYAALMQLCFFPLGIVYLPATHDTHGPRQQAQSEREKKCTFENNQT